MAESFSDSGQNKKRIYFMDELRGIAIIAMILYHLFFSMYYIFNISLGNTLIGIFMPYEPLIAGVFIFLSGVSSSFSKSNYLRGFKLLIVSLAITLVTAVIVPQLSIKFGILHFLACAIILFQILKKLIIKIPVKIGIAASAVIFLLSFGVPQGYIGIKPVCYINLPWQIYKAYFLFPLGFPAPDFYSADYFPLIPWFFLFAAGGFAGIWAAKNSLPRFMYKKKVPFLCFLGRHSLVIYIVHQPVIIGILWVITNIFNV